jgi:hypothetical protein
MGKCSACGKKIQYNQYEKVDGIIYCFSCYSKRTRQILDEGRTALDKALTIDTSKLNFDELKEAMEEPGKVAVDEKLTEALGEPVKIKVKPKKRDRSKRKKSREVK